MKMTSEMKSKVMSLDNRLAPKMDGGKSAAFIRAWAIVKAGCLCFGTNQGGICAGTF
jgi:hypothetical protein